ncbi:hypothetical protein ACSBM8_15335 [Sphingomonas sp. ASY06-1R]|uniref:hypothetical protein n=1 Tax=Sphingomonas sp. ASY06-1R TaxID=3445771 RepID=UPI003FA2AA58
MASEAPFVLFESNFGSLVRGMQAEGLHASLKQIPVVLRISMPQAIRDRFKKDPLLNNDVQLKIAAAIRLIVQNRLFPSIHDNTRDNPALRQNIQHVFLQEQPGLNKIVTDAIGRAMASSAAWNDYRNDSAKEISRISVTLALAAAAAAAAPPTGGASIALMIVTLVRGLTDAAKKFGEAFRTAEESRLRVIAEIATLKAAYDRSPALGRASQLGGAVAHALTVGKIATIFRSDPLPGFTRIKTELNAYKGKLGHLNEYAERLGSQLYDLLEKIEAFRDEHGVAHGDESLFPELTRLERKINLLLIGGVTGKRRGFREKATISQAWTTCQNGMTALAAVELQFKALKAEESRETAILLADRVLTLITNVGVGLAGYNGVLAAAGDVPAQVQTALRINPADSDVARGASVFAMTIARQCMSLFKDGHALAKELGIVTKAPDRTKAQLEEVNSGLDPVVRPSPPSRAGANLIATLEARHAARHAASGRPPPPTRPPPPIPDA